MIVIGAIGIVATIIFCDFMESTKKFKSNFIISLCIITLGMIGKIFTPTIKEAAFIYIAPAIVNNQDIQKTIQKIPELSSLGLGYLGEIFKQEIKDAKGEVKEGVKKVINDKVKE